MHASFLVELQLPFPFAGLVCISLQLSAANLLRLHFEPSQGRCLVTNSAAAHCSSAAAAQTGIEILGQMLEWEGTNFSLNKKQNLTWLVLTALTEEAQDTVFCFPCSAHSNLIRYL